MMGEMAIDGRNHDPLRLRELLGRAENLAARHALSSVVVGMAGLEGDLIFPEIVDYVESALRVDDAIFRLTRERAVLVLADVDRAARGGDRRAPARRASASSIRRSPSPGSTSATSR